MGDITRVFLGGEAITLEGYRRLAAAGKRPDTASTPPAPRVDRPVPLCEADPGVFSEGSGRKHSERVRPERQ